MLFEFRLGIAGSTRPAGRTCNQPAITHINNPDFPNATLERVEKLARDLKTSLYTPDDQSAVVVDGKKIEVVSEGKWEKFNGTLC